MSRLLNKVVQTCSPQCYPNTAENKTTIQIKSVTTVSLSIFFFPLLCHGTQFHVFLLDKYKLQTLFIHFENNFILEYSFVLYIINY